MLPQNSTLQAALARQSPCFQVLAAPCFGLAAAAANFSRRDFQPQAALVGSPLLYNACVVLLCRMILMYVHRMDLMY